jgi:hypothetical protein
MLETGQEKPAGTVGMHGSPLPKVRLLTLEHLDGRTAAARLVRDLVAAMEEDLGGSDRLTAGQHQLVQRAAVLGAFIENCEARWIAGEQFDTAEYLAAINVQRRVLVTIGLSRRARDVTSLSQYLNTRSRPGAMADSAASKAAHELNRDEPLSGG